MCPQTSHHNRYAIDFGGSKKRCDINVVQELICEVRFPSPAPLPSSLKTARLTSPPQSYVADRDLRHRRRFTSSTETLACGLPLLLAHVRRRIPDRHAFGKRATGRAAAPHAIRFAADGVFASRSRDVEVVGGVARASACACTTAGATRIGFTRRRSLAGCRDIRSHRAPCVVLHAAIDGRGRLGVSGRWRSRRNVGSCRPLRARRSLQVGIGKRRARIRRGGRRRPWVRAGWPRGARGGCTACARRRV